ncbi:hypothetical protein [Francisella-like endosymbiont]|uniref:hypothetical protein n=1 Tax=Francisella-like endosymbiont TaxID=512373 RepID=UPI00296EBEF8
MITSSLPGAYKFKLGFVSKSFFGVKVTLLDTDGNEIIGVGKGALCIKRARPNIARKL